ncbi:expansin A4 [Euphorbia peplus]|nr:expansin A4 [Euphorbia peplus]
MALLFGTALLICIIGFQYCYARFDPFAETHSEATISAVKRNNLPPGSTPGPWSMAYATFYEGDTKTFGGACNYKDVVTQGYGYNTTALSNVLFGKGAKCGACYEVRCARNPKWCKPGQPSLILTATDHCPPNPKLPNDNGGWCNEPRQHFDIAKPVFAHLADFTAGIIPIDYRRIPCKRKGGIQFTLTGNQWFYDVTIWNVAAAGDIESVAVKGDNKLLNWVQMERDWGSTWKTVSILKNESLSFKVIGSDHRISTSLNVTPRDWEFGETYYGTNFV